MLKRSRLMAPGTDTCIGRPRLLKLMGRPHKITLLAAPAGFGKSTLASALLNDCRGLQGWLSLDASDRDGTSLWLHLITCLRQARADFGTALLPLLALENAVPPGLIDRLVEEVAEWRQDAPQDQLYLVLDDLHSLDDGTNLPLLLEFLSHTHDFIRIVITSRSAAFLARASRLAPGSIDLIDQHLLAFDASEVDALAQTFGVRLTPAVRDRLLARTEGWVTPIQMILGQMRSNTGVQSSAQSSAQSTASPSIQVWNDAWLDGQTFALAPLIREHYNSQPADTRTLLCALALPPQFDQQLIHALQALTPVSPEAVTSSTHTTPAPSTPALDRICADTFIIRLDQPGWWKIHELYRTHLLAAFAQLDPAVRQQAVAIIADWQCRHGAHLQALQLLQQHAAWPCLREHLLQHYHYWLQRGLADVLNQAALLPTDAQIAADPQLCLLYLWARSDQLELQQCLEHLDRARAQAQQRPDHFDLLSEISSLASYCAQVKGQPELALQEAQRALDYSRQALQPFRARALLTIGLLTYMNGHMGDASAALAQALVAAQDERYHFFVILALGYWVAALHQSGQFDEALAIHERTRQWLIEVADGDPATDVWLALPPLDIVIARGDMDDARRRLKPLLQFADHATPSLRTALIYFRAMRFHYYNGDCHTALEYLSRVEVAMDKLSLNWTWGWAPVAAWRRKIALRQNRRQELLQWYAAHPVSTQEPIAFRDEEERLLDADVMAQTGLLEQAEALAQTIARNAAQHERIFNQLLALIVLGNIAHLRDPRALNPVATEAETLAQHMGARCILRVEARWTVGSLVAPQQETASAATTLAPTELVSRRERDVLVLLAQGKSDKEIADELNISFNTAKTHMKNILRKLDVKNRTEALVRARAKGIL